MRKSLILILLMFGINAVLLVVWLNKPVQYDVRDVPSSMSQTVLIPDFSSIENVTEKKTAYFDYLAPSVKLHNSYLLKVRSFLNKVKEELDAGKRTPSFQLKQLEFLANEYKVDWDQSTSLIVNDLLNRIDIIPVELVLVQSANESAWGTSRFAQQGFNLFGLWCFVENCGFVPSRRIQGASHEVAKFESLEDAVYVYMRNLNRHFAYEELRQIRSSLRQQNKPVTADALVVGLTRYSERGMEYVEELQHMLRTNQRLIEL